MGTEKMGAAIAVIGKACPQGTQPQTKSEVACVQMSPRGPAKPEGANQRNLWWPYDYCHLGMRREVTNFNKRRSKDLSLICFLTPGICSKVRFGFP